MKNVKRLTQVLLSGHTMAQKRNFMEFIISGKSEVLGYQPVTLSIVATGRCTLACDMCPTHSRLVPLDYEHSQKTKTDIEFTVFKDILDRFSRALTVHIIGSGEPLLNKDLFRMVEYAAEKRMVVKTITNGTLLSENGNIDKILSSKLEGITVSLNGHNAQEFSRMTGMKPHAYDAISDNVKRLVDKKRVTNSKVRVKLSFILDKENLKFIDEMIDVSQRLGVDHTFFCNFLPAPFDGLRPEERVLFEDEDLPALRDACNRLSNNQKKRFTFPPLLKRSSLAGRSCESHFSQMRIDGEGNASSCSMMLLNMENNGKFYDNDAWNSEFFRSMRRMFIDSKEPLPEPCQHCVCNYGVTI